MRSSVSSSVEDLVSRPTGSVTYKRVFTRACRSFHFIASLALAIGLVPAFRAVRLPLHFDWPIYFKTYWSSLAAQSIFAAALLYVLGFPIKETVGPLWTRCRKARFLIPLLLLPIAVLIWLNGFWAGLTAAVVGIALIEWFARSSERRDDPGNSASAVVLPAIYFFLGFVLVLSYNDVIAALRFDGSYDLALNRLDSWLTGTTVSAIAHGALAHLPPAAVSWMEWVYVLTFPQIGAGMILVALRSGRRRALRFVATILTAYYISLALFFCFPATGPYYICHTHFSMFPDSPWFYNGQRPLLDALRAQHRPNMIGLDYFIGFPCMHIAQPVIVLWYVRKWKRVVAALLALDCLLIPSILILEQHYLVDLLGGVLVAMLAIAMLPDSAPETPSARP